MFHAFIGCDTVSCCVGGGKRAVWDIWNVLPKVTDCFLSLARKHAHIITLNVKHINVSEGLLNNYTPYWLSAMFGPNGLYEVGSI